ncbi:response regulator transcription factor [Phyllobacterium bourgognense]|uniref:Response regulator receiver domain-containing protein n=1 Tax=Phyllobacterium bourgognense TaxID=314236 RepID=A0A368YMT2_9HYPH|nr:response regulator [Phyllobacterium bourgognense]RCW81532.1 response regulator receiver domain-containing protein [Phyllobacterium bourgognense]
MTEKAKILICDDDLLLLDLVEFKLKAKGYSVVRAENGEDALVAMAAERPDLIVLDAMMPLLDGFEVLKRVKQDPNFSPVPVVMLTARRAEKDIVSALDRGADDYLVKPFIPDELLARISRLLAARR